MADLFRYIATWGGRPMNGLDVIILLSGMVICIVVLEALVALIESIKGLL